MHAFNCRSTRASVFALKPLVPLPLLAAVTLSAAIHLVAVLVPSLRVVFQTFPLSLTDWGILLGLSAAIIPAVEGFKLVSRG
jgi:Ca2+-transporting ATPase